MAMQFGNLVAGIFQSHRELTEARIRQANEIAFRQKELDLRDRLTRAQMKLMGKQGEDIDAGIGLKKAQANNANIQGELLGYERDTAQKRFGVIDDVLADEDRARQTEDEFGQARIKAMLAQANQSNASAAYTTQQKDNANRFNETNPDARAVYTGTNQRLASIDTDLADLDKRLAMTEANPTPTPEELEMMKVWRARRQALVQEKAQQLDLNQRALKELKLGESDTGAGAATPSPVAPPPARKSTGVSWD